MINGIENLGSQLALGVDFSKAGEYLKQYRKSRGWGSNRLLKKNKFRGQSNKMQNLLQIKRSEMNNALREVYKKHSNDQ